ncbi:MAG: glycerate kinase [Saprospiraceae bacterium]|nr:glycerate kinase [Saprospiraceae bacterium]
MLIILAPDKFKGSISSKDACHAIEAGIRSYNKNIDILHHPMGDGGEGSLNILNEYLDLDIRNAIVYDPLWRPTNAVFGLKDKKAFIEIASASGLTLLKKEDRNPLFTSSFGTGQLIAEAIKAGASEIYLLMGGSATNDGGIGMAAALGYRFMDVNFQELRPEGSVLSSIHKIIRPEKIKELHQIKFISVTDVVSPFCGPEGAAIVYAAQKGATQNDIIRLSNGMKNLADNIKNEWGTDIAEMKGAGAAGGIAGGSVAFLNAELVSGMEWMMKMTHFDFRAKSADLIITGEGALDATSLNGKVVSGISAYTKKQYKKLGIIVGKNMLNHTQLLTLKADCIIALTDIAQNEDDAIKNVNALLKQAGSELMKNILEKG